MVQVPNDFRQLDDGRLPAAVYGDGDSPQQVKKPATAITEGITSAIAAVSIDVQAK
jgi:ribosomal protein L25 (general stress protein Ctc)